MVQGIKTPAWGAVGFGLAAGVALFLVRKIQNRPTQVDFKGVSLWREVGHWRILAAHVWPLVMISLVIWTVDSFFWVAGAVWTERLVRESFWGAFIIPAYQLPPLFMGFVVAKWGIYQGKKRLAIEFLTLGGLFLAALGLTRSVPLTLILIFASSLMLSVTHPMVEAVYSDLVVRLLNKKDHLIGLSSSVINIAYIIGPILAGFLSYELGERLTFSYAGMVVVFISVFLFFYTPKKLRLPQTEIQNWKA
jgi:MFS family permease